MPWWQSSEICGLLACPICQADVGVEVNYAGDGLAVCSNKLCGELFPIVAGIPRFLINNRETILDAGCGLGRFTACACHLAPKAVVIGVDLSRGVDFGPQVVQHVEERYLERCLFVQASIFALPFKPAFDLVFSFGVLHHTPLPKKAFHECLRLTTPGGTTLAWVYGDDFKKSHPVIWRLIHLARQVHSRLHPDLLWVLCHLYALSTPLLR